MPLSPKARAELAELGITSERDLYPWEGIDNEDFLRDRLEEERLRAAEYRRGYPQLLSYAAECRRAAPPPDLSDFTPAERAQCDILRSLMCKSVLISLARISPNSTPVIYTSRVGLPAAIEFFRDAPAVILDESEKQRWFDDAGRLGPDATWWFSFAWWILRDSVSEEFKQFVLNRHPLPEGCTHWMTHCGWTGVGGSQIHSLWRWNGVQAELVEDCAADTFFGG